MKSNDRLDEETAARILNSQSGTSTAHANHEPDLPFDWLYDVLVDVAGGTNVPASGIALN